MVFKRIMFASKELLILECTSAMGNTEEHLQSFPSRAEIAAWIKRHGLETVPPRQPSLRARLLTSARL